MNILLRMEGGGRFILALLCHSARKIMLTRRWIVVTIAMMQQMQIT